MELKFKSDTKIRKWRFVDKSFQHPAKMVLPLQLFLLERYTRPGDVVLDPMCGSGTVLVGCSLGRNVVAIDIEEKFVDMTKENWEKIKLIGPELGHRMGEAVIKQGDARNLEGILCDVVLTSPPYSKVIPKTKGKQGCGKYTGLDLSEGLKRVKDDYEDINNINNLGNLPHGSIDSIITSPPYATTINGKGEGPLVTSKRNPSYKPMPSRYSDNDRNIGNLPHGSIDSIITSPPYAENPGTPSLGSVNKDAWGRIGKDIVARRGLERGYSKSKENIGNLPHGRIDSIITSPPYAEAQDGGGIAKKGYKGPKHSATDLVGKRTYMPENVGDNPENIALLPYADAVITSPPFAESAHHSDDPHDTEKYRPGRSSRVAGTAGDSQDNIGQLPYGLKGQTYLSEMLKVYQQCFNVLRPGGLLILVVKNFIRNRKIVRLDLDTIRLCEMAGFRFLERHYRKLTQQSFWRIISLQKCDHRKGSKQEPKCELGLTCPTKEVQQLALKGIDTRQQAIQVFEQLCPSYINSNPRIDSEDILIFQKPAQLQLRLL